MFLPDHSVWDLRRALHQFYTAGASITLASILGLNNIQDMEVEEDEEEMDGPAMLSSDSFWDDEGTLHEAQEELFAEQDYLESSEDEEDDSEDDSLEDEGEDGQTGEYTGKQSEIFLTSTECKKSPIKSIGREAVEGLGLCFVSPILKDYEEPEPGEREVSFISIWFLSNKK